MPSFLPKVGEIINVLFISSEEGDFHIDTFYCLWFNRLLFNMLRFNLFDIFPDPILQEIRICKSNDKSYVSLTNIIKFT